MQSVHQRVLLYLITSSFATVRRNRIASTNELKCALTFLSCSSFSLQSDSSDPSVDRDVDRGARPKHNTG